MAKTGRKSAGAKGARPQQKTRSAKAGLIFPVGRTSTFMKKGRYGQRMGGAAPVYLAAVLEYLVHELVDQAGEAASAGRKEGGRRITPRHIAQAVRGDDEFAKMLAKTQISAGGMSANVQAVLFPKNKGEFQNSIQAEAQLTQQL